MYLPRIVISLLKFHRNSCGRNRILAQQILRHRRTAPGHLCRGNAGGAVPALLDRPQAWELNRVDSWQLNMRQFIPGPPLSFLLFPGTHGNLKAAFFAQISRMI